MRTFGKHPLTSFRLEHHFLTAVSWRMDTLVDSTGESTATFNFFPNSHSRPFERELPDPPAGRLKAIRRWKRTEVELTRPPQKAPKAQAASQLDKIR